MIHIRSEKEIEKLRSVCQLAAETMEIIRDDVRAGTTALQISEKARQYIESRGARAAFLGYNGFPGAICVSVNDEVVHGIPGKRILQEGDIIKIDLGTYHDGFYGDMARSFPVGTVTKEAADLIETTCRAFFEGAAKAVPGNHIGDIGEAVQTLVEAHGCSVVRALVGHGIGRRLHEEPQIPNFKTPRNKGALLKAGMVLAIEPMVNTGTFEVETMEDNWTVVTEDGKLSAHYENTCVVREGFPEILTLMSGE